MNVRGGRVALVAILSMAACATAGPKTDRAPFELRDGYEEARFGGGDVTVKTRTGARTLHVSLAKLRVAQTTKRAMIRLPGTGLALLQHTAGTAKVFVGRESFEPLEGEWFRLPLPAAFDLGTDNDTIQLDLILIEEKR